MQRDMNLCRAILRKAGEDESVIVSFSADEFPENSSDQVKEHVFLMEDAGLICPELQTFGTSCTIRPTWAGHDFLDLAKSDSVWQKVVDTLIKQGVPLTLDLVKGALQMHFTNNLAA